MTEADWDSLFNWSPTGQGAGAVWERAIVARPDVDPGTTLVAPRRHPRQAAAPRRDGRGLPAPGEGSVLIRPAQTQDRADRVRDLTDVLVATRCPGGAVPRWPGEVGDGDPGSPVGPG